MERRYARLGLAVGVILLVGSALLEGPGFLPRAAAHVAEDLTLDLGIHLFLLGVLMERPRILRVC